AWPRGDAAATIAIDLNKSTSAVQKKAQAMGLRRLGRAAPIKQMAPEVEKALNDIQEKALPHIREDGSLVILENVRSKECRFPMAKEVSAEMPLCGRLIQDQGSWCPMHRKKVFQKASA